VGGAVEAGLDREAGGFAHRFAVVGVHPP
jgi:hypothetical protein